MSDVKAKRTRNWLFVLYPESALPTWKEYLQNEHIPYVCSPLHDKDVNPDGEPKKSHWHVLLCFDGVKTYEQVNEITNALCGTIPIPCQSTKGAVRYFVHLDNPEKYQYNLSDIECYGGIDIHDLLMPSVTEQGELLQEIFSFCRINGVTEYSDLCDYCVAEHKADWFMLITRVSTLAVRTYLSSRRHKSGGAPLE